METTRTEYATPKPESIEVVSPLVWRVVIAGFLLTLFSGVVLVFALANGAANPPRAANLVIDLSSAASLEAAPEPDHLVVSSLAEQPLPVSIEAAANAAPAHVWGLWLRAAEGTFIIRLRSDGYFSIQPEDGWQEFIHIQPGGNTISINVASDGSAEFRINGEIAWRGNLHTDLREWGIIQPSGVPLDWQHIRFYAG